jgi:hypothetical protein
VIEVSGYDERKYVRLREPEAPKPFEITDIVQKRELVPGSKHFEVAHVKGNSELFVELLDVEGLSDKFARESHGESIDISPIVEGGDAIGHSVRFHATLRRSPESPDRIAILLEPSVSLGNWSYLAREQDDIGATLAPISVDNIQRNVIDVANKVLSEESAAARKKLDRELEEKNNKAKMSKDESERKKLEGEVMTLQTQIAKEQQKREVAPACRASASAMRDLLRDRFFAKDSPVKFNFRVFFRIENDGDGVEVDLINTKPMKHAIETRESA